MFILFLRGVSVKQRWNEAFKIKIFIKCYTHFDIKARNLLLTFYFRLENCIHMKSARGNSGRGNSGTHIERMEAELVASAGFDAEIHLPE